MYQPKVLKFLSYQNPGTMPRATDRTVFSVSSLVAFFKTAMTRGKQLVRAVTLYRVNQPLPTREILFNYCKQHVTIFK